MSTKLHPFAASACALLLVFATGCGEKAPVDPGSSCEPKTCEGEGWQCGTLDDGCGNRVECGSCASPLVCGGGDDPHVCAPCPAETTADFCARYERDCGPFTGANLCGASRSVNCGICQAPMICGGGGLEGRCGTPECQPESVAQLCARLSQPCGALTALDNCSQERSVDCGTCPDAAFIEPPDAALPAGPDADFVVAPDAAFVEPPDAAFVEPPDAAYVEPPDAASVEPPDAGSVPVDVDAGTETCAAETTRAQLLPLDIYIMLDQSISMDDEVGSSTQTYWQAVTAAIDAFLSQPLDGVSVGIQYFGIPHFNPQGSCYSYYCTTSADCSTGCGSCSYGYCSDYDYFDDSCLAADYATPDVEIAPLPGVATAIRASIARHSPNTLTPSGPALQGAIDHARQWATSRPGHVVIDIFATDGNPSECSPTDATSINAIAAGGVSGAPKVLTFVIGIGSSLNNLNGIAAAGGTGQAFLVDTSANVTAQMLAALNAIRGAALGCAYSIPPPTTGTLDLNKVNVQYTPGGTSTPSMLVQVVDASHCPAGSDGWHYDDSANPSQIVLCADTCQKVQADTSGQVDILIGCVTQHCPPTVQCGFGF